MMKKRLIVMTVLLSLIGFSALNTLGSSGSTNTIYTPSSIGVDH